MDKLVFYSTITKNPLLSSRFTLNILFPKFSYKWSQII